MDLPIALLEELVAEAEIYYFGKDAAIGVPDHYHICVKKHGKMYLFTACTSQIDTIYRYLSHSGTDPNTIPCLSPNAGNGFRVLTFVNCNQVYECESGEMVDEIRSGRVRKEEGNLSEEEMLMLVKGIRLSRTVSDNIKSLFG